MTAWIWAYSLNRSGASSARSFLSTRGMHFINGRLLSHAQCTQVYLYIHIYYMHFLPFSLSERPICDSHFDSNFGEETGSHTLTQGSMPPVRGAQSRGLKASERWERVGCCRTINKNEEVPDTSTEHTHRFPPLQRICSSCARITRTIRRRGWALRLAIATAAIIAGLPEAELILSGLTRVAV